MTRILIIGYGNPLRGDDGIGWHAANVLRKELTSETIRVLSVQQLAPELAEEVSAADYTIFIDADSGPLPKQITITNLKPDPLLQKPFHHHMTPELLLSYAESIYGRVSQGILFSVTGNSFEFNEQLSKPFQVTLKQLLDRIRSLIHTLNSESSAKQLHTETPPSVLAIRQ